MLHNANHLLYRLCSMPTFPTYHGELPKCLSPFKLRHYLLLAYWIYFRPTALKYYLYQADPTAYRIDDLGLRNVGRLWHTNAWGNLWLMIPGEILLWSILVGIPTVLVAAQIQGTSPDWLGLAGGVGFGVAFGVAYGVTYGVGFGVTFGVALGVA
ncbi:MAG: hypothetical protein KDA94_16685, partial [Acidimicrobiales bacterium]|nr:hypothetical protein [Acidimicrobiales bacterium]